MLVANLYICIHYDMLKLQNEHEIQSKFMDNITLACIQFSVMLNTSCIINGTPCIEVKPMPLPPYTPPCFSKQ